MKCIDEISGGWVKSPVMGKPRHTPAQPFHPPDIATAVFCIHCKREYQSFELVWVAPKPRGRYAHEREGYWACPTMGCTGRGFGHDVLPVDPHFRAPTGVTIEGFDEVAERTTVMIEQSDAVDESSIIELNGSSVVIPPRKKEEDWQAHA